MHLKHDGKDASNNLANKNIKVYVEEFKQGDYTNFTEFYNSTKKQVYFTAYAILKNQQSAQDVTQETFISFLNTVSEFDNSKNVYAYLTVIARNKCINVYNKEKRQVVNDELLINTPTITNFDEGGADNILMLLDDETSREIITYHVILGYKFNEIASIINKPLGTVLWKYNRALKILKKKVGDSYEK